MSQPLGLFLPYLLPFVSPRTPSAPLPQRPPSPGAPGPPRERGELLLREPRRGEGTERGVGGVVSSSCCAASPLTHTPFSTGFSPFCRKPPRRLPVVSAPGKLEGAARCPGRLLLPPQLPFSDLLPAPDGTPVPPPGPARRGSAPAGGWRWGRPSQANSRATRCGLRSVPHRLPLAL